MANQINSQNNTVINTSKGFGSVHIVSTELNENSKIMTIDEVRAVLNESLEGKELFDYIRMERNER